MWVKKGQDRMIIDLSCYRISYIVPPSNILARAVCRNMKDLRGGLEKLRATSRLHARVGFRPVKRELFRSLAEQPAIEVLEREQLLKQQIER